MKLAILETGRPPAALAERFGDYPAMFAAMLGPEFDLEVFDVSAGKLPSNGEHDAYLITGSPAGVYDDMPWIAPLLRFIRSVADKKLVGICFGHQAMAEALGGKVEKSEKGWGVGLQNYAIDRRQPWIDGESAISSPLPSGPVYPATNTQVIASSDFTPFAGFVWTDRPAISFQFHPEFEPDYAKALIAQRHDRIPNPDTAIVSLDAPNDRARVAEWIRRFLKTETSGEYA